MTTVSEQWGVVWYNDFQGIEVIEPATNRDEAERWIEAEHDWPTSGLIGTLARLTTAVEVV